MAIMRNWSTEHTKEVKKWLDINTYRGFEDLTLIQLYHELLARTLFFKPYHEEFEVEAVNLYIKRIFSGNPCLITEKHLGYLTGRYSLSTSSFLFDDNREIGSTQYRRITELIIFWDGSDEYSVNREFLDSPVSEALPKLFRDTVMVEIDLANGTDEEIAESLKAALPQWRKYGALKPIHLIRSGLAMEPSRKSSTTDSYP